MSWPVPFCSPPRWPANLNPARFAARIHAGVPIGCRVAILGLPDDLGIRLNRGRPGAKDGPQAFREALCRYGSAEPYGFRYPRVFDAGDIIVADGDGESALNETHDRVTLATREIQRLGMFPIAIGGGHDLTFPFVRGVIDHHRHEQPNASFEGLYLDAHLDVRETPGSGMPFRRLVENCGVSALDLYGFNPLANSPEHADWFLRNGGRLCTLGQPGHPRLLSFPSPAVARFLSLDLDVLDASCAPGVSAVNPCGLSSRTVESLVLEAARSPSVACFDIMELSPPHDEHQRTARLAAHFFLTFLRGFSSRPAT